MTDKVMIFDIYDIYFYLDFFIKIIFYRFIFHKQKNKKKRFYVRLLKKEIFVDRETL